MFKKKGSKRIESLTQNFKRIAQELKESVEETKEEVQLNNQRVFDAEAELRMQIHTFRYLMER